MHIPIMLSYYYCKGVRERKFKAHLNPVVAEYRKKRIKKHKEKKDKNINQFAQRSMNM